MYRYYSRRFLNLRGHHAGAHVLAIVEQLPKDLDEDLWWSREVSLTLADCARQVTYDFPLHTAADRRNSLRKARLLAEVTMQFADALATEAELAAARPRRRNRDRS
jgi:hypothetical protein